MEKKLGRGQEVSNYYFPPLPAAQASARDFPLSSRVRSGCPGRFRFITGSYSQQQTGNLQLCCHLNHKSKCS